MADSLTADARRKAEALVASGRFKTVEDALEAGLDALHEDAEWQEYASDRIEAGWADMEAGRTKPWDEVKAWLDTTKQKRA